MLDFTENLTDEMCENPGDCLSETLADIRRITFMREPVVRNLLITQRYHELSLGLAETIDEQNVNWSTFATWASKTAGESIRKEEVPRFVIDVLKADDVVDAHLARFGGELAKLLPTAHFDPMQEARDILRSVSEQVAEGNLKVFAELAPVFARFIDEARAVPGYDEGVIEDFEARFASGPAERGGQDLLKSAFRHYYQARNTADPKQRAELILFGNCEIGLHEQTRLQPNIRGAMGAPVDELLTDAIKRRGPLRLASGIGSLIGQHLAPVRERFKREWERVATRYAMNLSLPDGKEIDLGGDVPAQSREFPPQLERIDDPALRSFLSKFDRNLDSLQGSAARNWASLPDRMGFIVDLFRSRQQELSLLGPPFSEAQRAALDQGRLPEGPL